MSEKRHAVCAVTRKRAYTSREAAKRANEKNNHTLRIYECPSCRFWHVAKR